MEHTTMYYVCMKLIQKGKTAGLQDKLDLYLAMDRITADEYSELTGMLGV